MSIFSITQNKILITGCIAWICSQAAKVVIFLIINKRIVWERLIGDGGMPSSHSATVTSVAVATALTCGWDSPVFAVACIMALIVMHDAMGVRLEAGKHAKALNDLMDFVRSDLTADDKLKELLGHTPLQVAAGIVLGLIMGVVVSRI